MGQVPVPNCGDGSASHDAPRQTGKADQAPLLQVRVVDPDTMPLVQVMLQVPPLAVCEHEPVANVVGGLLTAGQVAALHTGRADQTPAVHVRVVEPDATPYAHATKQVPPLGVTEQEPEPYCGGVVMALQLGALHTGAADHTPLLQVITVVPLETPNVQVRVHDAPLAVGPHVPVE